MNAQCSTFCMTTGECGHLTLPHGGKDARTAVTRPAYRLLWQSVAGLLVYLLATALAQAQTQTLAPMCGKVLVPVFDTIVNNISDTALGKNGWQVTISGLLVNTFRILAVIEICWAAAVWAFEKDSLNSLAIEFIKKIMFIGFFYMLLTSPDAQQWIYKIPDSFVSLGEQAITCNDLSTDAILSDAIYYINSIWLAAPQDFFGILGALGKIIVADFVSLGVLISYVIIAAQYFTLKVESYIMLVASTVFLVLGISSWTNEYVGKYLNYAINVGVRLLVLILVLGLAKDITVMQGFTFDYGPLFQVLAIVILQAILAIKAPELAGALLNGMGGLSAGGAAGAAGSALGGLKATVGKAASLVTGAAGVAGAAMGALRSAVSAGQGASPGKAVNSGNSLAQAQGKSGAVAGLGTPAGAAAQQVSQRLTSAIKSGSSSSGMGKSASGGGTGPSRLTGSGSAASAQSGGSGSGAKAIAGTPIAAPGQSELGGKSVGNGASPSGTGASGRSPAGSGIRPVAIASSAPAPQSDIGSGTEPEESADGVNPDTDGSMSLSGAATLGKATATQT